MSPTEKKLLIIALLSIVISITGFAFDTDPRESGIFNSMVEIFLAAFLLFIIIAINYFALSFFIRKLSGLFRSKNNSGENQ